MNKAVIFHLGVVSDLKKVHAEIDSKILFSHGVRLTAEEMRCKYWENNASKYLPKMIAEHKLDIDRERWMKKKWGEMADLPFEKFKEVPGATKLIGDIRLENFHSILVSFAPHYLINKVLASLRLVGGFHETISAHDMDMKKRKNDAEMYAAIASVFRVFPEEMVVVADDMETVKAVKEAGMKCICLVPDRHWRIFADKKVESLEELSSESIQTL